MDEASPCLLSIAIARFVVNGAGSLTSIEALTRAFWA
jgi:hypothetical protein